MKTKSWRYETHETHLFVEVFIVSTHTHTTCIHTICEVFNGVSASFNGYCLHISLNCCLQIRFRYGVFLVDVILSPEKKKNPAD